MKTKAAVIGGDQELADAFSSKDFAEQVLGGIVFGVFDVKGVFGRPAEYYIQSADVGPAVDPQYVGVEVRMTGISRDGRTPKQFHTALNTLEAIVEKIVLHWLEKFPGSKCQIFCVLMLDGDVETSPGSGMYSSVLEGKAFFAGQR